MGFLGSLVSGLYQIESGGDNNMDKEILNALKGRIGKQCPYCNQTLKIVFHGWLQEKYMEQLKENNIPFFNAGCCCYGDDRDEAFRCSLCDANFDRELQEIKLVSCPRVRDYYIRQEYCGNETKLQEKYSLKSEVYCEACQMMIHNSDDEYRRAAYIIGLSEELIEQVINKKNSNQKLKDTMLYKQYLCEEDDLIHRLKYWD